MKPQLKTATDLSIWPEEVWVSPHIGGLATYAHKAEHPDIPTVKYVREDLVSDSIKRIKHLGNVT